MDKAIQKFDSYVDLSDTNLPLVEAPNDGALTLYGFLQFDIPDMRVEFADTTKNGVPVLKATPTVAEIPAANNPGPTNSIAPTANQISTANNANNTLTQLMSNGATFNNCMFTFNNSK